jgi:uncharacterized membrane protein
VSCAALGIDRKGDIVGQCGGRPVVWREGIVIPLAMPPGARFGSAHVINERGTIAGDVEDAAGNRLPVRWRDGVPEPLPLPAGASGGHAAAINDRDQIVGYVNTPSFYDPVLWDQGGVTPLAGAWGLISGYARGINNRGEIALHAFAGPITEYGAYIWRDGRLRRLEPTGSVNDINDRGVAVGIIAIGTTGDSHGAVWPKASTRLAPEPGPR